MAELLLQILWPVVVAIIGSIGWYQFFFKKERRLFKNIGRPIAVVSTDDKPMGTEVELLRRVGFFNVSNPSNDARVVDSFNGKRLVIIGYTPNSDVFRAALEGAKQRQIPVIVFAGPTRIENDDMELLQNYTNHSMCNTPLRLISDTFAVMSTYPEEDN